MIAPTHVSSSSSASVVIDIDDLTISDLLTLVDIKRARERTDQDELYTTLLWTLDQMPRSLANEIARELDELHPAVVLERHFPRSCWRSTVAPQSRLGATQRAWRHDRRHE